MGNSSALPDLPQLVFPHRGPVNDPRDSELVDAFPGLALASFERCHKELIRCNW